MRDTYTFKNYYLFTTRTSPKRRDPMCSLSSFTAKKYNASSFYNFKANMDTPITSRASLATDIATEVREKALEKLKLDDDKHECNHVIGAIKALLVTNGEILERCKESRVIKTSPSGPNRQGLRPAIPSSLSSTSKAAKNFIRLHLQKNQL
jgi:hypothetical protein